MASFFFVKNTNLSFVSTLMSIIFACENNNNVITITNQLIMTKISVPADLKMLRLDLQEKIRLRESAGNPESIVQVKVAMATCGIASGAREVMNFFTEEMEKRGVDALVTQTGCMGYCYAEPTIEVTVPGKDPVVFGFVDKRKADEIIEKYIKSNEAVEGVIPIAFRTIAENRQEGLS